MATDDLPRLAALAPALPAASDGLLIADCTEIARFGLRGKGSYAWLKSRGVAVPDRINVAAVDADGMLVLRLGQSDIAISGNGEGVDAIAAAWRTAEGTRGHDGYRRDSWAHLAVSGRDATALMAELTDIDLRDTSMPRYAIAQTRLLHVDTIIVRTDPAGIPGYELFFDLASRAFVLENLRHMAHSQPT
ncbi:MAG: hypothetical protein IBJ07_00990 [Rhizobiaceae bacterium]|nr:hypothetical protein [Rhizobiaceae bacterium]